MSMSDRFHSYMLPLQIQHSKALAAGTSLSLKNLAQALLSIWTVFAQTDTCVRHPGLAPLLLPPICLSGIDSSVADASAAWCGSTISQCPAWRPIDWGTFRLHNASARVCFLQGFLFREVLLEKVTQLQKHGRPLYVQGTTTHCGRDLLPSDDLMPEVLRMGHQAVKRLAWKFGVSH